MRHDLATLVDPFSQQFNLGWRERIAMIRRGHAEFRIVVQNPAEEFAAVRFPRDDGSVIATLPSQGINVIESQIGLPSGFIRTVTGQAATSHKATHALRSIRCAGGTGNCSFLNTLGRTDQWGEEVCRSP